MSFKRTFHTVGQGAFYSENFKGFRMVYDCGSTTLSAGVLKNRIMSDLSGDPEIDLLFISHFDADHINGVKHLNPKIIVLPFLSKEQIFVLETYNKVAGRTYYMDLIENPSSVFPEAQIIRVMPEGFERNINPLDETPVSNDRVISLSDNLAGLPKNIKSNTTLKVLEEWEYIPFNPNWEKYAEKFKEKVEKELDWQLLNSNNNGKYVKKYLSVLKTIYDSMGSKNLHSLILYSNSLRPNEIKLISYSNRSPWDSYYPVKSGCIYFGDALIEKEWLNGWFKKLTEQRTMNVGMMQVPHHGSYLSKGELILKSDVKFPNFIFCIISVAEVSQYGHPSTDVIQKLKSNGGIVMIVTESISSLVYCSD